MDPEKHAAITKWAIMEHCNWVQKCEEEDQKEKKLEQE